MFRDLFAERREKLRPLLARADLAALLVSFDANRYYLSGFELHDTQMDESSGRLIIRPDGKDLLCTDSRFADAAARVWDKERIFVYKNDGLEQINALLKDTVSGKIGFEAGHVSVQAFASLGDGLDMEQADGLVESLRMIKSPEEILLLEKSCRLNHRLMQWLPGVLEPGRSEMEISWEVEKFFREHGAEEMAFPSIVAVNGNSALPHARPGRDPLADGCCLLVDTGCRLEAYCSDQTRTFRVGDNPDPLFPADLDMVREAQELAIARLRPGAHAAEIYRLARSFLDEKGVGALFTHGLGHGIGLQTHEAPGLNPNSRQVLRPGMVLTVEPGIYRPGQYGVRWEYMVLITEDGARVL
ncbi:MAG: aminopeptidase P family protein [Desulfovibrio sp.]|jgi:Xaa-Pro aminopeptidase|nr:aminopeptidase P family protein [Desulfovibrio sp.]